MCALCDGKSMEDYVVGVEGLIERYGWALQYVDSNYSDSNYSDSNYSDSNYSYSNDSDPGVHDVGEEEIVPAFCYTVGLTTHGCPELILTGRSAGESAAVLNSLARRILIDRECFYAGDECDAGRLRMSFVDVVQPDDWLLMACRIYSGHDVQAIQAVWRDVDGYLPWEGPFPSAIVQPVLGPPPGWYDESD